MLKNILGRDLRKNFTTVPRTTATVAMEAIKEATVEDHTPRHPPVKILLLRRYVSRNREMGKEKCDCYRFSAIYQN